MKPTGQTNLNKDESCRSVELPKGAAFLCKNHKLPAKPVGQANLRKDESYRPTELPKGATFLCKNLKLPAKPVGQTNLNIDESCRPTELPKAQPFFDKVFRAGGIKYCVTAYAKEELLRALNLSERTDA